MKKWIKMITAALVVLFSIVPAMADENVGEVVIKYPLNNVEFKLFYLGEWKNRKIDYQGEFANSHVTDDLTQAAEALAVYANKNQLTPTKVEKTNNGEVMFTNVKKGIYLILADDGMNGKERYHAMPTLLSMPNYVDNTESWFTEINAKYNQDEVPDETELEVIKVWDDNNSKNRPNSIEVELLRNNEVYDTKTLSKSNNWKYKWTNLDGSYEWSVYEKSVFNDYTVAIEQENNQTIITNKSNYKTPNYKSSSSSSSSTFRSRTSRIPQTGQLWWPVVALGGFGVLFIVIGIIRGKYSQ